MGMVGTFAFLVSQWKSTGYFVAARGDHRPHDGLFHLVRLEIGSEKLSAGKDLHPVAAGHTPQFYRQRSLSRELRTEKDKQQKRHLPGSEKKLHGISVLVLQGNKKRGTFLPLFVYL